MPGSMDELKLARAIRDRWPPIELILTLGHFDVAEGDPIGKKFSAYQSGREFADALLEQFDVLPEFVAAAASRTRKHRASRRMIF